MQEKNNKIRNAFANNMLTNIKLSKAQLTKMFQSSQFLDNMMTNCGGKKY